MQKMEKNHLYLNKYKISKINKIIRKHLTIFLYTSQNLFKKKTKNFFQEITLKKIQFTLIIILII